MRLLREKSRKMYFRYMLAQYSRMRTNSSNLCILFYGKKSLVPMHNAHKDFPGGRFSCTYNMFAFYNHFSFFFFFLWFPSINSPQVPGKTANIKQLTAAPLYQKDSDSCSGPSISGFNTIMQFFLGFRVLSKIIWFVVPFKKGKYIS